MNATLISLIREFIKEVRIRARRTKCPFEKSAATTLEQEFLQILKKAEAKATNSRSH